MLFSILANSSYVDISSIVFHGCKAALEYFDVGMGYFETFFILGAAC